MCQETVNTSGGQRDREGRGVCRTQPERLMLLHCKAGSRMASGSGDPHDVVQAATANLQGAQP